MALDQKFGMIIHRVFMRFPGIVSPWSYSLGRLDKAGYVRNQQL